ncbi:MAG TPA: hypothetical protein VF039_12610 [Longimicrobiales bacterium]
MIRMNSQAAGVLALVVALGACDRPDDQPTGSISADDVRDAAERLSPEVRAALDSGNAAYRRHDFESALRHYHAVTEQDRNATAGWFGIYMAQRALGDTIAAQQALEQARDLAPGATIMHPAEGDTTP